MPRVVRFSLSRIAALVAAGGLAACATTSEADKAGLRPAQAELAPAKAPKVPTVQGRSETSLYGLFLAGEAALGRGSSEDAARFLGRASEIEPHPYLRERAFTASVIAGDISRAAAIPLAPGEGSAAAERLARLVRAVDALAAGKGADSLATLRASALEGQLASATRLLTPWAAAVAGDWNAALGQSTAPGPAPSQLVVLYGAFGRAQLLERAGRFPEAEESFKALTINPENVSFVLAYGGFLERRGRRPEAVALYERTLAKVADAEIVQARNRARSGRSAPSQPSLQEGAGEALLAPAIALSARRQPELGLALMRLALRLHPKLDDAWMAVGDAMAAAGDPDAARRAYSEVAPSSAKYGQALSRLAWSSQRGGEPERALAMAKDWLARSPKDPSALSLYADLLRENGRFADSIGLMDKLLAAPSDAVEPWRVYYLRGVAWERTGRWDKAEPDLKQALKLKPDDPEVMNYLGFGWANRFQNLQQALDLLQKAVAARPRSGEIRDSLGWAKFRLGRYPDAVRDLERAVQLAPAQADINDHLGDAYWKVGRKLEAEFQWRRVLSLDPDEALRALAETKLQGGLDAAAPPAAVASASGPGPARP